MSLSLFFSTVFFDEIAAAPSLSGHRMAQQATWKKELKGKTQIIKKAMLIFLLFPFFGTYRLPCFLTLSHRNLESVGQPRLPVTFPAAGISPSI